MLEDTPEDGAVWAVERLRRSLNGRPGHRTVRAGVACYPGHALNPTELMDAVRAAFAVAQQWPQDRIEAATYTPPSESAPTCRRCDDRRSKVGAGRCNCDSLSAKHGIVGGRERMM